MAVFASINNILNVNISVRSPSKILGQYVRSRPLRTLFCTETEHCVSRTIINLVRMYHPLLTSFLSNLFQSSSINLFLFSVGENDVTFDFIKALGVGRRVKPLQRWENSGLKDCRWKMKINCHPYIVTDHSATMSSINIINSSHVNHRRSQFTAT